jgi:predicted phosphohydrolase
MAKMYITGDVHGNPIERLSTNNFPIGKDLTNEDVVLITGDFGVLFSEYDEDDFATQKRILSWLDEKPFTTLFIGGNHENWDTLNSLTMVEKFGVPMGKVSEKCFFIPQPFCFTFRNLIRRQYTQSRRIPAGHM